MNRTENDERQARIERLRDAVRVGLRELDRGAGIAADDVFADLREHLAAPDR